MGQEATKLDSGLTGVAGEYLVAGELTRRGYIASITLRNTRGIDILVTNSDASRSIGIQVKTGKNKRGWMMNKKGETFYSNTIFYIFVNIRNDNERAEFIIVPSKVVADYVKTGHADWLKKPSRSGVAHKDTDMRRFNDKNGEYLERWSLLDL